MDEQSRAVDALRGVGPKRAALFARLGVRTVEDLLRYYPRGYEDFTEVTPVAQAQPGQTCCLRVTVTRAPRTARTRGGMLVATALAADDTGVCEVVFFNNRYAQSLLKEGEAYFLYGRLGGTPFKKRMASPQCVPASQSPGLLPVYAATAGLPSRAVAQAVREALALAARRTVPDPLPDTLRRAHALCHLDYALQNVHFPKDKQALEVARRRLVFGELLSLLLGMGLLRRQGQAGKAPRCLTDFDFAPFFASLPYAPTGAQARAVREAAADMVNSRPMNRLIEGDVGSGKTTVAAALCVLAHASGLQAALMAPTEILAAQHAQNLTRLLAPAGMRVALLTGGLPAAQKRETLEGLANGQIHLVVGTHALLTGDVAFANLGLVVTDEQHRFGVAQRAALAAKGQDPHMLIMSATPIPRTLSLMIYGDLDVSVLDELPKGRWPVRTFLVGGALRARVHRFLRRLAEEGQQAYLVCPLVEPDESGLAAVVSCYEEIAAHAFAGLPVGLLHGRMPAREKDAALRAFARGETKLLVATTVVEVGVDVPNATVMVVENAERFGLSQLHQLRGRVGRGDQQSYCILLSDAQDAATRARLQALCHTNDGFKVAEEDLRQRGPGDFFGKRQHGLPALAIADLMGDLDTLQEARAAADSLLKADSALRASEHAGLREAVQALFAEDDVVFN